MYKLLKFLFFCTSSFFVLSSLVQELKPPFYDDIESFKKQDSISSPKKNSIVFIGSSSFTMWKNVQEMFPDYQIINRGFGGSSLPDVQRYLDKILFPYQPKQVVIYVGENDVASDTVDSRLVTERFKSLFQAIRSRMPDVPIVYISMKPSPSREKYLPIFKQANQMINNFLYQQKNVGYVDVYSRMLDASGKPKAELFLDDNLHMNEKGYAIWQQAIRPYLLKN